MFVLQIKIVVKKICRCMFPPPVFICHVYGGEKEQACRRSCARCACLNFHARSPVLGDLHHMIFFWRCVCMHGFCKHLPYVCMHVLCICLITFSTRLAVPVCTCVQVAHDPGSAGRSVSFMSTVQLCLKSGSKDERITLIRFDTHAYTHTHTKIHWHTLVSLKNDFLEIWLVTRWHRGHLSRQLLKFTQQQTHCPKSWSCHLSLLTIVTHCISYSFSLSLSPFLCLPQFDSVHHSWPCVHQMRMLDLQVGSKSIRNALLLSGSWHLCVSLAISFTAFLALPHGDVPCLSLWASPATWTSFIHRGGMYGCVQLLGGNSPCQRIEWA